jgi:hypothetical protein
MLPRWWLTPDYEPPVRDAEGLVWELRGAKVKTMAENDFLDAAGIKRGAGGSDPMSQRWADLMTERYDDLAKADPVFAQLRNCMDLALVSALIAKENLLQRAGLEIPALMGSQGGYVAMELNAPRQIPTKASLIRKPRMLGIAAGGVQINPWEIVNQVEQGEPSIPDRSYAALEQSDQWWSN